MKRYLEGLLKLNYMLILDAIKAATSAGKLFPAERIAPWSGEPRAFLMCKPLYDSVQHGRSSLDEKERQSWAKLEAAMSHFIEGGYVTDDLIKQLGPPKYEHWELRSRKPRPSLRVFGRFACPDVFVGTHVCLRKALGGMWSPQYEHEKLVCEDHWKDAGMPAPYTAPPDFHYESYMTSNARKKIRVKP